MSFFHEKTLNLYLTLFFIFLGCLPVFALNWLLLGTWSQAENISLCLSTCMPFIALLLLFKSKQASIRIPTLFLIPVGIFFCGICFAPFQAFPLRTLYGAPELGESTMMFLNVFVLSVAAFSLRHESRALKIIFYMVFGMGCYATITALLPTHNYAHLQPYHFPSYIAFYGVFLPLLYGLTRQTILQKKDVFIMLLLTLPIWLSENLTARLGLCVIAPVLTFILCRFTIQRQRLFAAVCLMALPILFFLITYFLFDPNQQTFSFLGERVHHMASRHYLLQLIITAFQQQPSAFFTGFGFGSFSDLLTQHIPMDEVHLYSSGSVHAWDALTRHDFHPHHVVMDILSATGIFGAILYLAMPAAIVFYCKAEKLPVVFFGLILWITLNSFWFQYPLFWPLFALVFALCIDSEKPLISIPRTAWLGLVLVLCGFGYLNASSIEHAARFSRPLSFNNPQYDNCHYATADGGRGGLHLAMAFANEAQQLAADPNPPSHAWERYFWMACNARGMIEAHQANTRLLAAYLISQEVLMQKDIPAAFQTKIEQQRAFWPYALNTFLQQAPARSDMAIPYLSWQLSKQNDPSLHQLVSTLLANRANDPVGLWFDGMSRLSNPETLHDGLKQMKMALQFGIEKRLPVEARLKEYILSLNED